MPVHGACQPAGDVASGHRHGGYYHELFNETGAARVFADLQRWPDAHAALRPDMKVSCPA